MRIIANITVHNSSIVDNDRIKQNLQTELFEFEVNSVEDFTKRIDGVLRSLKSYEEKEQLDNKE